MSSVDSRGLLGEEKPRNARDWSLALSRAFAPCSARPRQAYSSGTVRRVAVHDLELVDVRLGATAVTRGRRAISSTDRDCFALLLPRRGTEIVTTSAGSVRIQPGEGALWRFGSPAAFESPGRLAKLSLIAPAHLVSALSPTPRVDHLLCAAQPALRVLSSYLDVLLGSAATLDPGAQEAARNAALELLRAALCAREPDGRDGAALHAALVRWIDTHLTTAELSPGHAAHVHGVSVRTVHRVFADHGETFTTTVRNLRLERARRDIVLGCATFTDIAHRWGFSDGSHFTRRFRERYGVTPRDARRLVDVGPADRVPAHASGH